MKSKFKSKNKKEINILNKLIFLTIILITLFTFFLLTQFNKDMTKKLETLSEQEIRRVMDNFLTERINHNLLNKETLEEILIITKNKNDEILTVDFNLDGAYKLLDSVSDVLTASLKNIANGSIETLYFDQNLSQKTNNMILSIPIGSLLKSPYFYNLGPKIPLEINFIGAVLTNLETKITNYGLNNALVEVFIKIKLTNQIITPFNVKPINLEYNTLIASKMIEGSVPNFYDGVIEKNSNLYSKSLE